jgi:hypothetical protein
VILGHVLPGAREIARHEAYHAAALCLAGLVPKCVRTDWPDQAAPGATDIDWGEGGYRNPAAAKSVLVLVLRATTEGSAGWEWETWPIDAAKVAEGARGDALLVLELVEHFDMDRVDWCHDLWRGEQLGRRQDFRRLVVRITEEVWAISDPRNVAR